MGIGFYRASSRLVLRVTEGVRRRFSHWLQLLCGPARHYWWMYRSWVRGDVCNICHRRPYALCPMLVLFLYLSGPLWRSTKGMSSAACIRPCLCLSTSLLGTSCPMPALTCLFIRKPHNHIAFAAVLGILWLPEYHT